MSLSTGSDAGGLVHLQLEQARRAAETVSSGVAAGCQDLNFLEAAAAEAASCLASVTDSLTTVDFTTAQLRAAATVEARDLAVQLTGSLARLLQHQALAAAGASRAALAAGDLDAATVAAIRAQAVAAVMLKAAYVSGLGMIQEVMPSQRAAAAAVEAAAAAAPLAGAPSPSIGGAWRDGVQKAAAAGACATGPGGAQAEPIPGPSASRTAAAVKASSMFNIGASVATGLTCLAPEPTSLLAVTAPEPPSATQAPASVLAVTAPEPPSATQAPASVLAVTAPEPPSATQAPASAARGRAFAVPQSASAPASAPAPERSVAQLAAAHGRDAPADPWVVGAMPSTGSSALPPEDFLAAAAATAATSTAATAAAAATADVDAPGSDTDMLLQGYPGGMSATGRSAAELHGSTPSDGGNSGDTAAAAAAADAACPVSGCSATAALPEGRIAALTAAGHTPTPATGPAAQQGVVERCEGRHDSTGDDGEPHRGHKLATPRSRESPLTGASTCPEHRVLAALSQLAALANLASADGQLPPSALRQAGEVSAAVLHLSPEACTDAMFVAWGDARTRCDLLKLLSCAVRQLPGMTATSAAVSLDPCWCCVLKVLSWSLESVLVYDVTVNKTAVTAEVVRLLVRTDLVQCLSIAFSRGLSSAGAEAAGAAGAAYAAGRSEDGSGSGGGGGTAPTGGPQNALCIACGLLNSMVLTVMLALCSPAALTQPELQDAVRGLRNAMLHSRVVEHCMRWAASGAAGACSGITTDGNGATSRQQEVKAAAGMLKAFLQLARVPQPPLARWAEMLMAGPCVQYFLLLQAVSQLCAADGGSDYGLPSGARLPAVRRLTTEGDGGAGRPGAGAAACMEALSTELMTLSLHHLTRNSRARPCSDRVLRVLCKRAAAAAVASASWAVEGAATASTALPASGALAAAVTGTAAGAEPAADAAGCGGPLRERFAPPEAAMGLALVALDCAITLTRQGSNSNFRGLWAPVVTAANVAVHVKPHHLVDDGVPCPLQLLLSLPLPPLPHSLSDASALSPQPCPDVAAALAAGYVPALERAIRNQARLAGASTECLASVARSIELLLTAPTGMQCLPNLVAYGQPVAVASLLATLAKVSAFVREPACNRTSESIRLKHPLDHLHFNVRAVGMQAGSGLRPLDRLWWRRHVGKLFGSMALSPGSLIVASGAAAAGHSSSAADGGGGGREGDGGYGNDDEGAADSGCGRGGGISGSGGDASCSHHGATQPLLCRVSLLTTFIGVRWIRQLVHGVVSGRVNPWGSTSRAVTMWVQSLVHAYLQTSSQSAAVPASAGGGTSEACTSSGDGSWPVASRDAATDTEAAVDSDNCSLGGGNGGGNSGGGSHSRGGGSGGGGGQGGDGGDDRWMRLAAASWKRLLLGVMDLPQLLGVMARALYKAEAKHTVDKHSMFDLQNLVTMLLHLLVAFPSEARPVLQMQLQAAAGGCRDSLLGWLQRVFKGRAIGSSDTVSHFLELAPVMAAGRDPTTADVARLRSARQCTEAVQLGDLLPPPCFVAAALPELRLCANPTCANLEGDSEVGLRLTVPCKGCGGVVSYCCRGCKKAHWRAGHKSECGAWPEVWEPRRGSS